MTDEGKLYGSQDMCQSQWPSQLLTSGGSLFSGLDYSQTITGNVTNYGRRETNEGIPG